MTAKIIDGKIIAVVLIGDEPASQSYVASKSRAVAEVGMRPFDHHLPADIDEAALLALVQKLNADPAVHGILVQLPLPPQIRANHIIASINPDKDVDGFHPLNAGRLVSGLPALAPCTPIACIKLIKTVNPSLAGREALMVGRSHIVGNPLAQLMLREHTTVTIAHTRTRDLPALCRRAEILCVAIGRAQFIRGAWIRPGATVIDIGINRIEADGKFRIVGDVDFAEALQVAGAITPVPGGVGPMTIACLLTNTLRAACMQAGLPEWQV
jgi:methylenetetrahydrofolate dehydrogenase (NADP+)/methenyltetrahydrofolate cyclohydrolase